MDPNKLLLYAIIFGVVVIVIAVGQFINKRKAEHSREVMKKGPRIERYEDPSKAVKPDDVITSKNDSKQKVLLWWDRSGVSEGICGVCNCRVEKPNGYLIPLKAVAESTQYLDIAIKPMMEFGMPRDQAVAQIKEQILADQTPWLVCEDCIDMFFSK